MTEAPRKSFVTLDPSMTREQMVAAVEVWLVESGIMPEPPEAEPEKDS